MAQSYLDEGIEGLATFSLFVRHLPPERGYLIAAGLEDALAYLEGFAFTPDDLTYLASTRLFSKELLVRLSSLRFTGRVRALPEGTVCFGDEPLLEVTAPIPEAQLVETMLINEIQLQTMIATKAARCVTAAARRPVVDFSLRRTHGAEAGLKAARASFLGGAESTSNVLAGKRYGIPIAGTMAHSYVEAFPSEIEAFRAYARTFPDGAVLLIDTYDPIAGARHAAAVGREMVTQGHRLRGVRIDSGDLIALSRAVREILDAAWLNETTVFASGGLDEYAICDAVAAGAPITGFGVGTRLGTSADSPHLDIVYKLVSYEDQPRLKLSAEKATWPGAKQVWRTRREQSWAGDWLGLEDEAGPVGGEPLLVEVMAGGRILAPPESLAQSRARCREHLAMLPDRCRDLRAPESYPVQPTAGLRALAANMTRSVQTPP